MQPHCGKLDGPPRPLPQIPRRSKDGGTDGKWEEQSTPSRMRRSSRKAHNFIHRRRAVSVSNLAAGSANFPMIQGRGGFREHASSGSAILTETLEAPGILHGDDVDRGVARARLGRLVAPRPRERFGVLVGCRHVRWDDRRLRLRHRRTCGHGRGSAKSYCDLECLHADEYETLEQLLTSPDGSSGT